MGKSHNRNKARRRHITSSASQFLHRDSVKKPGEVIMPQGFNTTTGPLLKYLEERPGQQVTLPELMKALNRNETQIRASLSYMRTRNFDIKTVVTGHCWIYRAAPSSEVVKEAPAEEKPTVVVPLHTGDQTPAMRVAGMVATGPLPVDKPKFTVPKVDRDVEFFQVVSKSEERVILKDSEGRVYKATEI